MINDYQHILVRQDLDIAINPSVTQSKSIELNQFIVHLKQSFQHCLLPRRNMHCPLQNKEIDRVSGIVVSQNCPLQNNRVKEIVTNRNLFSGILQTDRQKETHRTLYFKMLDKTVLDQKLFCPKKGEKFVICE